MTKKHRKPRSAAPEGDAPGIGLEKLVVRIQQLMDPNSQVTHNEWLMDRLGNSRQYDVVIRGEFAGQPILGVVECKDHGDRIGPDYVESFATKARNLGVNLAMMVSKRGFTDQALNVAGTRTSAASRCSPRTRRRKDSAWVKCGTPRTTSGPTPGLTFSSSAQRRSRPSTPTS